MAPKETWQHDETTFTIAWLHNRFETDAEAVDYFKCTDVYTLEAMA